MRPRLLEFFRSASGTPRAIFSCASRRLVQAMSFIFFFILFFIFINGNLAQRPPLQQRLRPS
jgi:hypothetical protein